MRQTGREICDARVAQTGGSGQRGILILQLFERSAGLCGCCSNHSLRHLTVVNALTNFANITLSSFYFDITKDCLYANSKENLGRRAVVTVLEQVGPFASVRSS